MNIIIPKEFQDSDIDTISVADSGVSEYVETNTYSLNDQVYVKDIFPPKLYTALGAVATYVYPPDNPDSWTDNGCPNRWKFLDEYITTQTVSPTYDTDLVIQVKSNLQNSLALFGITGTNLKIEVLDGSDTIISNQTIEIDLINKSAIIDWETYFFSSFLYTEDLTHEIILLHSSKVKITISSDSSGIVPALGSLVLGESCRIGYTQYNIKSKIIDFSTIETNSYGDLWVNQGKYAKKMELETQDNGYRYDIINRALIAIRGKLTVFEGNNEFDDSTCNTDFSAFRVLGIIQDYSLSLAEGNVTKGSFTIRGIT